MTDRRDDDSFRQAPARLKTRGDTPLASLVQALAEETPLSDVTLARIQRAVRAKARTRRRRPGTLGLRFGTVALLLVLGATVGAATTVISVRWLRPHVRTLNLTKTPPLPPVRPLRLARATPSPPEALALRADEPLVQALPPAAAPRPARKAAVTRHAWRPEEEPREPEVAPAPLSAPEPSFVQKEAALVTQALQTMRRGENAAAIAQLQGYLAAHPSAAFRDEAELALATALIDARRLEEARQLLHTTRAASPALHVLRGELAFFTNCAEAAKAFSKALEAPGLSRPHRERAHYGAAMAALQCHHHREARQLMQSFLHAFPRSPHAPNVRGHLANIENPATSP